MFCNQCGASLADGMAFCAQCGKAVGAVPTPAPPAVPGPRLAPPNPAVGRVIRHRNILGVLWLVRGCMVLLPALVLTGFAGVRRWPMDGVWMGQMPGPMHSLIGPMLGGIAFLLLALSALGILSGVGLLMVQSWARILAIVVGIIELISFPFGTALGIYTLWVLLPSEAEREYEQLARARMGL